MSTENYFLVESKQNDKNKYFIIKKNDICGNKMLDLKENIEVNFFDLNDDIINGYIIKMNKDAQILTYIKERKEQKAREDDEEEASEQVQELPDASKKNSIKRTSSEPSTSTSKSKKSKTETVAKIPSKDSLSSKTGSSKKTSKSQNRIDNTLSEGDEQLEKVRTGKETSNKKGTTKGKRAKKVQNVADDSLSEEEKMDEEVNLDEDDEENSDEGDNETDKNKDIPKNKKEAKKKDKNPKKAIKSNEITIENIDEEYQSDDSTDSDDDQLIGEVVDKENKRSLSKYLGKKIYIDKKIYKSARKTSKSIGGFAGRMLPGILKEEYILNGTLSGQPAKNQGDERAKEKTHMLNERAVAVAIKWAYDHRKSAVPMHSLKDIHQSVRCTLVAEKKTLKKEVEARKKKAAEAQDNEQN